MDKEILVVNKQSFLQHITITKNIMRSGETSCMFEHIYNSKAMVDRKLSETDERYLQVIPYCYITDTSLNNVFVATRNKNSGEKRLHNNMSLGFGGHIPIGAIDIKMMTMYGLKALISSSIQREFEEELHFENGMPLFNYAGFIYDESNAVGRVHLGLAVHAFADEVKLKEDTHDNGKMINITQLSNEWDKQKSKYETWSRIVFEHFIKPFARKDQ